MEPFIVITAPDHFSQQAVDNISASAKGIGELIGCKVIVEASGLQIRVEPPVHGVWREEPPTEPGWYRVLDNEVETVQWLIAGWSVDMMDAATALYDHRKIEFLASP